MINEKKINEIKDLIVKEIDPEEIILFGSCVWGRPGSDSDVDLFVIKKSKQTRRERQLRLRRLFLDFDLPVDILSYSPDEIKARLKINDLFISKILNDGKSVYKKKWD